jgi:hypothetical protein
MYRIFISLVCFVVVSFCHVSGAENPFVFSGGLNLSGISLSGDYAKNVESNKMSSGFNAGAAYWYIFNDQFGFYSSLCFETRGYDVKGNVTYIEYDWSNLTSTSYSFSAESNVRMYYLQVPLMLSCKIIPELAVFAGPELGVFLGGKKEVSYEGLPASLQNTFTGGSDFKDAKGNPLVKPVDIGLSIGAGYVFREKFMLMGFYYWGLLNIDNIDYIGSGALVSPSGSMCNRNIRISLGYLFK